MKISPNEIAHMEDIGTLEGETVKLARTKGGFHFALVKRKNKDEALAVGSHSAIVKYNLEKQYPSFQPSLMKSEHEQQPLVMSHNKYLSEHLKKSGHDIYSIQNGTNIEFQLTRLNIPVCKVFAEIESDYLVVKSIQSPDKQFSGPIAGAITEKSLLCGVVKVGLPE